MDEAGDSPDSRKRRYGDAGKERSRDRFNRGDNNGSSPPSASPAGFGRRPNLGDDYSDDEDDRSLRRHRRSRQSGCKSKAQMMAKMLRAPQRAKRND